MNDGSRVDQWCINDNIQCVTYQKIVLLVVLSRMWKRKLKCIDTSNLTFRIGESNFVSLHNLRVEAKSQPNMWEHVISTIDERWMNDRSKMDQRWINDGSTMDSFVSRTLAGLLYFWNKGRRRARVLGGWRYCDQDWTDWCVLWHLCSKKLACKKTHNWYLEMHFPTHYWNPVLKFLRLTPQKNNYTARGFVETALRAVLVVGRSDRLNWS